MPYESDGFFNLFNLQVVIVAIRNRGLPLPENSDQLYEIDLKEAANVEEILPHTNQMRYFCKKKKCLFFFINHI